MIVTKLVNYYGKRRKKGIILFLFVAIFTLKQGKENQFDYLPYTITVCYLIFIICLYIYIYYVSIHLFNDILLYLPFKKYIETFTQNFLKLLPTYLKGLKIIHQCEKIPASEENINEWLLIVNGATLNYSPRGVRQLKMYYFNDNCKIPKFFSKVILTNQILLPV